MRAHSANAVAEATRISALNCRPVGRVGTPCSKELNPASLSAETGTWNEAGTPAVRVGGVRCTRSRSRLSCHPMNGISRHEDGGARPSGALPARSSWAPVFLLITVVVTAVIGALTWNPRRPSGVDAWTAQLLRVSDDSFPYRFASRLDDTMRVLPVLVGSLAVALFTWVRLRRRDALVASLLVAPATAAAEVSIKQAGRGSLGLDPFTYPSGRAALAAALVLLLVLVLRAAAVRTLVRTSAAVLGTVYVLAMAWARVATGQHVPSDVLGGMSMGAAVTLAAVVSLRYGSGVPRTDDEELAPTVPRDRDSSQADKTMGPGGLR